MKALFPPLVVHKSCMTQTLEPRVCGKKGHISILHQYKEVEEYITWRVWTSFVRNSSKYFIARRADQDADQRVAVGLQSVNAACRYGSSIRSQGIQFRRSHSTNIMLKRPTENFGKFKKLSSEDFSCWYFLASCAAVFASLLIFQVGGSLAPAEIAVCRYSHSDRPMSPSRWPLRFQLPLAPILYIFGHHRHLRYIGFSSGFCEWEDSISSISKPRGWIKGMKKNKSR